MTFLIAALATVVALQYLFIAARVVPRLAGLAERDSRVARVAEVGAVAFFLGCAVTHFGIAIHTVTESAAVGGHSMLHVLPHIAQIAGGAAFLYVAEVRLDIRLRTKEEAKVDDEAEQLREQLARSQRLESVGLLAGGVAHDFNNVLAVIQNYTAFALEQLEEEHLAREDLEEVARAADRASDLTRQLLMFSRRDVLDPEVVDVREVVGATERLLRRTIGEHIHVAVDVAPDAGRTVLGAGQLEQVLMNLALNARDAMSAGGSLAIRVAPVTAGGEPAVELTVSDTGAGMEEHVAARAFDPFFTTKEKSGGTGLGLATVYGIVSGADGTVELDSAPGRGTTIRIVLPATDGDALTCVQEPAPAAAPGRRVLVAEDDEAVRALTVRMLEIGGHQVVEACDGQEALDLLQTGLDVDLLVTDVVMPRMSGDELAERATGQRPELAVVYMSGYLGDELEAAALRHGPLVSKPFTRDQLLAAVGGAQSPGSLSATVASS